MPQAPHGFVVNYSEDFDNLGVEISATAEKGQVKNSKSAVGTQRSNLFSYDVGATLSYFGFSFGASCTAGRALATGSVFSSGCMPSVSFWDSARTNICPCSFGTKLHT